MVQLIWTVFPTYYILTGVPNKTPNPANDEPDFIVSISPLYNFLASVSDLQSNWEHCQTASVRGQLTACLMGPEWAEAPRLASQFLSFTADPDGFPTCRDLAFPCVWYCHNTTFPKDYLLFRSQALLVSAPIPKPELQDQKISVVQAGNHGSPGFLHSLSAESSGGKTHSLCLAFPIRGI